MEGFFQKFIGLKWEEDVDEAKLKENPRVEEVRVLYPDTPMTRDRNPFRANVFVNYDKTITDITMG